MSPDVTRGLREQDRDVSYRWVEHTGEVQLEIEAGSVEAVFTEALRALGELLGDGSRAGDPVARDVTVEGRERAVLLVEWLDELVYLAEAEDLVAEDVERIELLDDRLTATVHGRGGRPPHLVKGATYHRLAFEQCERGFRATVVLDV